MIVGRQLAVETVVEGVGGQLAFQERCCAPAPLVAAAVPRKGTSSDQPAGSLGDDMVVGRRAAAGKSG